VETVHGPGRLARAGKLDQRRVLLVVEDLDALHLAIRREQSRQQVRVDLARDQIAHQQHAANIHTGHLLLLLLPTGETELVLCWHEEWLWLCLCLVVLRDKELRLEHHRRHLHHLLLHLLKRHEWQLGLLVQQLCVEHVQLLLL